MSSLSNIVASDGPIRRGDPDGDDVLVLQLALSAAGYRVGTDKVFGPRTEQVLRQFQQQHGLSVDGVLGPRTAAELDKPHDVLVAKAAPLVAATGWPHDDTASLIAFYGQPWTNPSLLTHIPVPFPMTYRVSAANIIPTKTITVHKKCADAFTSALKMIANAAEADEGVLRHVRNFSGTYNDRPVRGSSRRSTHAFGAAIDFDAGALPLGKTGVTADQMPIEVVASFLKTGAFWGGNYTGRKDAMHFQFAHE